MGKGRPAGSKNKTKTGMDTKSPKTIKKDKYEKHDKLEKNSKIDKTKEKDNHDETKPSTSESTPTKTEKRSPKDDKKNQKSPKKKEVDASPKKIATGYIMPLKRLNPYITCPLCNGYFVDATTVLDCLHTFCRGCLLRHFEKENNNCPKCQQLIHQSHPSQYVAFDRTMQDIVYKLVPGMQEQEMKRRDEFHRKKKQEKGSDDSDEEELGVPYFNGRDENTPKEPRSPSSNENSCENNPSTAHHRMDDAVVIELVPGEKALDCLERPFIRLSSFATINTIKRYISLILNHDLAKYNEYDVFCNNELMGRDYSMAFILKTRWRNKPKDEPLKLIYKTHIDF